jgi:hypothetical protein
MTEVNAPATQAELDAATYAAYIRKGENKSATGRELGISASTVADRVKRHMARTAEAAAGYEDQAAEDEAAYRDGRPEDMTEEEAEVYLAEVAAQDEAGESEDVFQRILDADPDLRAMQEPPSHAPAGTGIEEDFPHGGGEDCDHAGVECEHDGCPCRCTGCADSDEDVPGSGGEDAPGAPELPAGLNKDDFLAYRIPCQSDGCGAGAYQACGGLGRGGARVLMGYAHPVRVADAKRLLAARELEAPQAEGAKPAADDDGPCGCAGHEHGPEDREDSQSGTAADTTASGTAEAAAKAGPAADGKDGYVTECADCGFTFSRPQRRRTCQSPKACKKRQKDRAAAAG